MDNLDEMCDITRIGSGISGEVFKMTYGPTKRIIAAKVRVEEGEGGRERGEGRERERERGEGKTAWY